RGVDDPLTLHRFHPCLDVDDGLRVSAHPAGTGWVIRRASSLPNERLDLAVADHVGTRTKFLPTICIPNGLAYHRSRQSNAIDEILPVRPRFQMIEDDRGWVCRVCRSQRYLTATLRPRKIPPALKARDWDTLAVDSLERQR